MTRLGLLHDRATAFAGRVTWMSRLVGNPMAAVFLLFKIRMYPNAIHKINVGGRGLCFRASDEQALREVFVEEEYAFLRDLLCGTDTPKILDVGAHIGTFAIWCQSQQPKAHILSVEADPATFKVALSNAEAFQKSGCQWSVYHAAASARDGEVLRLCVSGPSMSHRISSEGATEVGGISLSALVDWLAPEGGIVDLVKVDIEGSEEAFLCERTDAFDRVNALVVELHPNLCNTQRVAAVLRAHFDHIFPIEGRRSNKPLLYCRRGHSLI